MMISQHRPIGRGLETLGAWLLGLLWMLPLLYAVWTAFHPRSMPRTSICWRR